MRKAFTLIEVLVVIAIICIVISMVLGAAKGCNRNQEGVPDGKAGTGILQDDMDKIRSKG